MKKLLIGLLCFISAATNAQIDSPRLSPSAKIDQTVGLTNVSIEYFRPSLRGRTAFGEVVPLNEIWRTGANKNTTFTVSDYIIIMKDTLAPGTYAIYTKPMAKGWNVYFYSESDNWGTPDEWNDENVTLMVFADKFDLKDKVETFTISIDNISTNGAVLSFRWDKTLASIKFAVPTAEKMDEMVTNTMKGPSARDYYNAADYYYSEKRDLKQALEWIDKAIVLMGDGRTFWMYNKKSLIQAEMGDYKGAIQSAGKSLEGAIENENETYTLKNQKAIAEWKTKL
jgi:tetratricopeptide (TPR) repeat protein